MEHIIKNFDILASSPLRRQALQIAEAGLEAINTRIAVRRTVAYDARGQVMRVGGKKYRLQDFDRVVCVGFGKAAYDAVSELQAMLAGRISCGFVIDLKEGDLGNIVCKIGTHPYPTKVNIEATRQLLAMLSSCTEKDLVLCVVSGGGSALLCSPRDLTCEQEVAIIAGLTVKGAAIQELNTVRKHISTVKGGQLAKMMYPATVISLIFSDVPGDDVSMVASGPTVLDATTARDAKAIIDKYDVLATAGLPSCNLIETPKDEKYFRKVNNVLAVSARQALLAMKDRAEELGYDVAIFSDHYQGQARDLASVIVNTGRPAPLRRFWSGSPRQVLLGAGESTVKILGKGEGGRNQEMALAALPLLAERQVLVCVASDGHDNTDAAGAIVDQPIAARAKALGLDPGFYLNNNDSYHFFQDTGGLLMTGLTGANVSDFFVLLSS